MELTPADYYEDIEKSLLNQEQREKLRKFVEELFKKDGTAEISIDLRQLTPETIQAVVEMIEEIQKSIDREETDER